MKTGNTLRTAKNSLLCFFMALAGGFLVACGSDGGGGGFGAGGSGVPSSPSDHPTFSQPSVAADNFPAYLSDTAAEGVEYSGPTGNGVTGEGGVFLASEGVFEFSIGATDLGNVSLNSAWANNEVTPSDFMGVDDAQVVTIARIMQGLDLGNDLKDGISISQGARDHPEDLSALLDNMGTVQITAVVIGGDSYTIPSADDAKNHLADTRKCLFSGGYVGDFEGTSADGTTRRGQSYYAVEPFVNRARRFTGGGSDDLGSFVDTSTVGVTGSEIVLSEGNTLSFITPRLVAGVWQVAGVASGTENLTLAADTGNPGATRRIVGVETTSTVTIAGMYVLDYFEEATVFRGRYYGVDADSGAVSTVSLALTIANGVSWPTVTVATMLTLIGDNTTITVGVVRANDNYGSFDGVNIEEDNELSGTWCDIGGAIGSTVAPTPPMPSIEVTVTWDEVPGATSYKLYRATMTVSVGSTVSVAYAQVGGDITSTVYTDKPLAGPEYFYQLEACNSAGCSERSSAPAPAPAPAAGGGDGNDGDGNDGDGNDGAMCRAGMTLMPGESCETDIGTFRVNPDGSATLGVGINVRGSINISASNITLVATRNGSVWNIEAAA